MKHNYLSIFIFIALCSLIYGCDQDEKELWMYDVREDGKFNFSSVLLDDFGVTVTLDSNGGIYQMVIVDWKRDSIARRVFFEDDDISAYHFCHTPTNNCNYYSFSDDMDLLVFRELIEKGGDTIDVSRRVEYDVVEKKIELREDYNAFFIKEKDIISYYSPSEIRYSKLDSSEKIKMEVTHNIKEFIENGFHPKYFHYNLVEVGDPVTIPWDYRGLPDTNVVQNFTLSYTKENKSEAAFIFYGTYSEKKDFEIGEEILLITFDTIRVSKGEVVY